LKDLSLLELRERLKDTDTLLPKIVRQGKDIKQETVESHEITTGNQERFKESKQVRKDKTPQSACFDLETK
jgi:hypothetical protein